MRDTPAECEYYLGQSQPQDICFSEGSAGASRRYLPPLENIDTSRLPNDYWKGPFTSLMSDTLPPFSGRLESNAPIEAAEMSFRELTYDAGRFERWMSDRQEQFDKAWGISAPPSDVTSEVAEKKGSGWPPSVLDSCANVNDMSEATIYEPTTRGENKQVARVQKRVREIVSSLASKPDLVDPESPSSIEEAEKSRYDGTEVNSNWPVCYPIQHYPIFPDVYNASPPPGSAEGWTRQTPSSNNSAPSASPPALAETYTTTPPRTFTSDRATEYTEPPPPMSRGIRSIPPPHFAEPRDFAEVQWIHKRMIEGINEPHTPESLRPWRPAVTEDSWCKTARSSGMPGPRCAPLGPVRSGVSGPMVDASRRFSRGTDGSHTSRGYTHGRAITSNAR
jgi:hypothetical protein